MDNFTATMIAKGVNEADEERQIEAWQHLVNTGLAWQLQGSFGRTAMSLIEAGVILSAEDYKRQTEAAVDWNLLGRAKGAGIKHERIGSGYGSGYLEYRSFAGLIVAKRLFEKLPHGSGINGNWSIRETTNGSLRASNTYSAMDDAGGYCHDYGFTVIFRVSPDRDLLDYDRLMFNGDQPDRACCGYGLDEYLDQCFWDCKVSLR